MASPLPSDTGSLFHVVMRFSWLLSAHVQPTPASLTVQPNFGDASTLIHGAG